MNPSRHLALLLQICIGSMMVEVTMAAPVVTRHAIEVEHISIQSQKSFDEVKAALERAIPQLDPKVFELLGHGEAASALKLLEAGPDLSIFLVRDHGTTLQMAGQKKKKALQYEIGNPLTASKMTRHRLPAALYAPLRVVLYENEAGQAVFEYDRPSSLFGQFGDDEVTAVGRGLDAGLERALLKAAQ